MVTRIRELLEARQLSPTQFADLIGVGRPVISHILSERNKPSLEVVQRVISAFPEVSLPWLLSGIGSMLATAPSAAASPASSTPAPTTFSAPATYPEAPASTSVNAPQVPPLPRPQPPRFRPVAQASTYPIPDSSALTATTSGATPILAANAPSLPAPPIPSTPHPDVLPPAPFEAPVATPVVSSPITPAPLPPTVATAEVEAVIPASTPSELPAEPTANSTPSDLSFLGEPGKAIRRIVIFYRDGSFSDYVPEG